MERGRVEWRGGGVEWRGGGLNGVGGLNGEGEG